MSTALISPASGHQAAIRRSQIDDHSGSDSAQGLVEPGSDGVENRLPGETPVVYTQDAARGREIEAMLAGDGDAETRYAMIPVQRFPHDGVQMLRDFRALRQMIPEGNWPAQYKSPYSWERSPSYDFGDIQFCGTTLVRRPDHVSHRRDQSGEEIILTGAAKTDSEVWNTSENTEVSFLLQGDILEERLTDTYGSWTMRADKFDAIRTPIHRVRVDDRSQPWTARFTFNLRTGEFQQEVHEPDLSPPPPQPTEKPHHEGIKRLLRDIAHPFR